MKCLSCKGKPHIEINKKSYCDRCFTKVMERRLRKYIRLNCLFKKNDKILAAGEITHLTLANILKGMPLTIDKANTLEITELEKLSKRYNKIVIPWSLEDEICLFLESFFSKELKLENLGPYYKKKHIKLFRNIEENELIEYARIKNLKFTQRKKNKHTKLLDQLQQKYPEVRFSLLKSIDKLLGALH